MLTITIRECKLNGKVWGPTNHKTDDINTAIRRAIDKHFGKLHGFYIDHGLTVNPDSTQYGQIGHSIGNNSSSMDTGRIRIDIE